MVMFSRDRVDVFTTAPGAAIRIGKYGVATNTEAVHVPPEVAAELEGVEGFRVKGADPGPEEVKPPKKAKKGEED